MFWSVKKIPERQFSFEEVISLLHSDILKYGDLICKVTNEEVLENEREWLPVYNFVELTSSWDAFLRAVRLFEMKKIVAAGTAFQEAMLVPGLFQISCCFMAVIYALRHEHNEALIYYRRCQDLPYLSRFVRNNLGVSLVYLGRIDEAHKELMQVIDDQDYKEALKSKIVPHYFEKNINKSVKYNLKIIASLAKFERSTPPESSWEETVNNGRTGDDSKDAKKDTAKAQLHEEQLNQAGALEDSLSKPVCESLNLCLSSLNDYVMIVDVEIYHEFRTVSGSDSESGLFSAIHYRRYEDAMHLLSQGEVVEALDMFEELMIVTDLNKRAEEMVSTCRRAIIEKTMTIYRQKKSAGDFVGAAETLELLKHESETSNVEFDFDKEAALVKRKINQDKIEAEKISFTGLLAAMECQVNVIRDREDWESLDQCLDLFLNLNLQFKDFYSKLEKSFIVECKFDNKFYHKAELLYNSSLALLRKIVTFYLEKEFSSTFEVKHYIREIQRLDNKYVSKLGGSEVVNFMGFLGLVEEKCSKSIVEMRELSGKGRLSSDYLLGFIVELNKILDVWDNNTIIKSHLHESLKKLSEFETVPDKINWIEMFRHIETADQASFIARLDYSKNKGRFRGLWNNLCVNKIDVAENEIIEIINDFLLSAYRLSDSAGSIYDELDKLVDSLKKIDDSSNAIIVLGSMINFLGVDKDDKRRLEYEQQKAKLEQNIRLRDYYETVQKLKQEYIVKVEKYNNFKNNLAAVSAERISTFLKDFKSDIGGFSRQIALLPESILFKKFTREYLPYLNKIKDSLELEYLQRQKNDLQTLLSGDLDKNFTGACEIVEKIYECRELYFLYDESMRCTLKKLLDYVDNNKKVEARKRFMQTLSRVGLGGPEDALKILEICALDQPPIDLMDEINELSSVSKRVQEWLKSEVKSKFYKVGIQKIKLSVKSLAINDVWDKLKKFREVIDRSDILPDRELEECQGEIIKRALTELNEISSQEGFKTFQLRLTSYPEHLQFFLKKEELMFSELVPKMALQEVYLYVDNIRKTNAFTGISRFREVIDLLNETSLNSKFSQGAGKLKEDLLALVNSNLTLKQEQKVEDYKNEIFA